MRQIGRFAGNAPDCGARRARAARGPEARARAGGKTRIGHAAARAPDAASQGTECCRPADRRPGSIYADAGGKRRLTSGLRPATGGYHRTAGRRAGHYPRRTASLYERCHGSSAMLRILSASGCDAGGGGC